MRRGYHLIPVPRVLTKKSAPIPPSLLTDKQLWDIVHLHAEEFQMCRLYRIAFGDILIEKDVEQLKDILVPLLEEMRNRGLHEREFPNA